LGRRLADPSFTTLMDYRWIPYSFFTGVFEYSSVGLSEDDAVEYYGNDKIRICFLAGENDKEWVWGDFQEYIFLKAVLFLSEQGKRKIVGLHMLGEKSSEFIMVSYIKTLLA
jgi:pyruvate/2-oxoglutarate dehydrogenase complex dihydrolipoamide dehydrogenase (E3) component